MPTKFGRNIVFRPPKCIKWATRKYVPLNRRFHDTPKIEIIRLPKCIKWVRECHVLMNRGFYDPPKIAPCVSWLRENRIFRTPKWRKWTHTKVCSLEPWVSLLEKNRKFRSQKWRKSTQINRSTLEQWVTRLGKNRIFMPPECRKWAYTKICTLNRLFESAEIAFEGRQSSENELTRI